ncbi:hypothetical protein RM844_15360 [Streptomyces sp. DSM 44915]|uniref:Uncharacterized protein n=1 Tax=Streptomyces chisholmiae TaxID=3075540 RepID=A0ABU2JT38_9ACTN|nr:hypothetical protein [Streptomyces sp. DSM 44915]MDT0267664.1 hypothetical protein [Streptomyces sp. DSM 44915]
MELLPSGLRRWMSVVSKGPDGFGFRWFCGWCVEVGVDFVEPFAWLVRFRGGQGSAGVVHFRAAFPVVPVVFRWHSPVVGFRIGPRGRKTSEEDEEMSKIKMRVAATAASLAVLGGVSVATAGSAAAVDRTPPFTFPASPTAYGACLTAGNVLAQQGKLIGFNCVATPGGGYRLIIW